MGLELTEEQIQAIRNCFGNQELTKEQAQALLQDPNFTDKLIAGLKDVITAPSLVNLDFELSPAEKWAQLDRRFRENNNLPLNPF